MQPWQGGVKDSLIRPSGAAYGGERVSAGEALPAPPPRLPVRRSRRLRPMTRRRCGSCLRTEIRHRGRGRKDRAEGKRQGSAVRRAPSRTARRGRVNVCRSRYIREFARNPLILLGRSKLPPLGTGQMRRPPRSCRRQIPRPFSTRSAPSSGQFGTTSPSVNVSTSRYIREIARKSLILLGRSKLPPDGAGQRLRRLPVNVSRGWYIHANMQKTQVGQGPVKTPIWE